MMNKLLINLYEKGIKVDMSLQDDNFVVKLYNKYTSHFIVKGEGNTEHEAMADAISKALLLPAFEGLSVL